MQFNAIKKLKVCYLDDIRVFRYDTFNTNDMEILLHRLEKFVEDSFKVKKFNLQYVDEENDKITMQCGTDLQDALNVTCKFFVAAKKNVGPRFVRNNRRSGLNLKKSLKNNGSESNQDLEGCDDKSKDSKDIKDIKAEGAEKDIIISEVSDESSEVKKNNGNFSKGSKWGKRRCWKRAENVLTMDNCMKFTGELKTNKELQKQVHNWLTDSVNIYKTQNSEISEVSNSNSNNNNNNNNNNKFTFNFMRILKKNFFSYKSFRANKLNFRFMLSAMGLIKKSFSHKQINEFIDKYGNQINQKFNHFLLNDKNEFLSVLSQPISKMFGDLNGFGSLKNIDLSNFEIVKCFFAPPSKNIPFNSLSDDEKKDQNSTSFSDIRKDKVTGSSLICKCGSALVLTPSVDCYGASNNWLQCDGCDCNIDLSKDSTTKVWHCPTGHDDGEFHKYGVDLCQGCYDVKMLNHIRKNGLELICHCGAPLVRKQANSCYKSDKNDEDDNENENEKIGNVNLYSINKMNDNNNNNNNNCVNNEVTVYCDGCTVKLSGSMAVWHCSNDKKANCGHDNGFDLCETCYYVKMFQDVKSENSAKAKQIITFDKAANNKLEKGEKVEEEVEEEVEEVVEENKVEKVEEEEVDVEVKKDVNVNIKAKEEQEEEEVEIDVIEEVEQENEKEKEKKEKKEKVDEEMLEFKKELYKYEKELNALKAMGFDADEDLMKSFLTSHKGNVASIIDKFM